jgi:hypothetical protein
MRSRYPGVTTFAVVAGIAATIAARCFVLPGIPVILGGDQSFFWTYAQRMLRGERIYRDFFQFTPPGTDLVYAAVFGLVGPRLWAANAVVVAVGAGLGWLCFRIARAIMGVSWAALAAVTYAVFVYSQPLSATHHWFGILAVMGAVDVVMGGSNRGRLVGAGALAGLGAFFSQAHGAAAAVALAVFVGWQARREGLDARRSLVRCCWLVGASIVSLLGASAYFIVTLGPRLIWYFQVSYVLRYMREISPQSIALPQTFAAQNLPYLAPYLCVYTMTVIGYGVTAAVYCRRRARHALGQESERLFLLWLVGTALLVEVSPSLSWFRIFVVSMPAIILSVWLLQRVMTATRLRLTVGYAAWAGVSCLALTLVRSTYRHHPFVMDLPAGRAAGDARAYENLGWLLAHTTASFFAGDRQAVYLPLGRMNPVFLDEAIPTPQTRPEYVRRSIAELDAKEIRYVLWSTLLEDVRVEDGLDGVVVLRDYVHERYHRIHVFTDGEQVWERN